jgi:hypothetical protein
MIGAAPPEAPGERRPYTTANRRNSPAPKHPRKWVLCKIRQQQNLPLGTAETFSFATLRGTKIIEIYTEEKRRRTVQC